MKKTIAYSVLFSFLVVIGFAALASAECLFLEIASINNATVSRGITARFPISLRNIGASPQLVSLGGSCAGDLDCSFDSSSATLAAGEAKVFTLSAGTARAASAYYEIPVSITAGGGASPCDYRTAALRVTQPAPSSASPSAPPSLGFDAELSPAGVVSSGRPGETIEYDILASNYNAEKGFVKVRVEGAFASTTLLSTTNFDLAGGAQKHVTAKVRLPPGTPGGSYELVFRVQATSGVTGETQEFSLPAAIFVFSDTVDVDLLNQPVECLQVKHDETLSWQMALRNNGQATGPFKIAVEAPASVKEFVRVTPSLIEVASGDQQPVQLFTNPKASVTIASYNFNLVVKYLEYSVLSVPLCVNVSGVTGFEVEKKDEYAVRRGVVTPLKLRITNTGSVSDDFSVQPAIVTWLNSQAVPSSFSLSPHESKEVSVVVTTALEQTPLGVKYLPVVVRSARTTAAELYNLKLRISSAPQAGLSYLAIKKTRFTVPAGSALEDEVEVINSKGEALHGVSLSILGIPIAWYSISPATSDIPAKSLAQFKVSWSVPSSKAGKHSITLYAESAEGETASVNATLEAVALQSGFSSSVYDVDYSNFESNGEIVVTVVLHNTGATTISGITPVTPSGFAFPSPVAPVTLAPGEQKTVKLSLKAVAPVPSDAQVPLQFQSSEGAVSPPITVFAAPPQKKSESGSWVLLAVIALFLVVAAAAYYLNKERGKRDEASARVQLEERASREGKFKQKKLV
jgi:uncharacterized membrane protein